MHVLDVLWSVCCQLVYVMLFLVPMATPYMLGEMCCAVCNKVIYSLHRCNTLTICIAQVQRGLSNGSLSVTGATAYDTSAPAAPGTAAAAVAAAAQQGRLLQQAAAAAGAAGMTKQMTQLAMANMGVGMQLCEWDIWNTLLSRTQNNGGQMSNLPALCDPGMHMPSHLCGLPQQTASINATANPGVDAVAAAVAVARRRQQQIQLLAQAQSQLNQCVPLPGQWSHHAAMLASSAPLQQQVAAAGCGGIFDNLDLFSNGDVGDLQSIWQ